MSLIFRKFCFKKQSRRPKDSKKIKDQNPDQHRWEINKTDRRGEDFPELDYHKDSAKRDFFENQGNPSPVEPEEKKPEADRAQYLDRILLGFRQLPEP